MNDQRQQPQSDQTQQPQGYRSYRREIMKLVGAGAAVATFGGVAAADEHGEMEPDDEQEGEYTEGEDIEMPDGNTVHVVRTLIRESTNPERPADFFYQPTGLHIEPGDVVKFVFETPDHTVTSYHPVFGMQRRIPIGVRPISSPVLGWDPSSLPDDAVMPPAENGDGEETENGLTPSTWLYAFETPGVYDIECAPHEAFGMAMRIVVGDETETAFETSDPSQLPPPRVGPVGLSRQVLTDPNLEPEAIVEEGSVEWMDLEVNQSAENGAEEEDLEDEDEDENGIEDEEIGDENGEDETEDEQVEQ